MKWLQEVRRMGTTADKVAALTLLLQESAVSNLRSLDELLRWVSKRSGARAVAGQVRTCLDSPAKRTSAILKSFRFQGEATAVHKQISANELSWPELHSTAKSQYVCVRRIRYASLGYNALMTMQQCSTCHSLLLV